MDGLLVQSKKRRLGALVEVALCCVRIKDRLKK